VVLLHAAAAVLPFNGDLCGLCLVPRRGARVRGAHEPPLLQERRGVVQVDEGGGSRRNDDNGGASEVREGLRSIGGGARALVANPCRAAGGGGGRHCGTSAGAAVESGGGCGAGAARAGLARSSGRHLRKTSEHKVSKVGLQGRGSQLTGQLTCKAGLNEGWASGTGAGDAQVCRSHHTPEEEAPCTDGAALQQRVGCDVKRHLN